MEKTVKKISGPKAFLLRTLTDPILWYTMLIMMSLMYHYRDREKSDASGYIFSICWGIATFFLGWIMFRVFDFVQKHHLIGSFMYGALAVLFGIGVREALNIGRQKYPILWGLWFLTPQDSLDYNKWYVLGFYLLFMLFMGSVIYYFTRVRYRIFMNFLIFIIPFAIYGKEYEKMPTVYIVLLAVGYILLMVYYRQLKDDENTEFVGRRRSWKTVAVYAAAFATVSALIPKPQVEADRSTLDTLISADKLTDKLDAMINVFRDTASSSQFRSSKTNYAVYEASSKDPLRLKTGVCSDYSFDNDNWSVDIIDDGYRSIDEQDGTPLEIGCRMGMADAFLRAAELDADFAEKYGLEEYAENGLEVPALRHATFYTINWESDMAPVPQFAVSMTDCTMDMDIVRLSGGTVSSNSRRFDVGECFEFDYSANTFFMRPGNKSFVEHLAQFDYEELLEDTQKVLYWEYLRNDDEELKQIYDYFSIDYRKYSDYLEKQLDYGKKARIKALANEITAGLDSEYDKACAIETYFYDNDYVYDLSYRKKKGENAESFLFDTKTGVCYEYATAMVLIARAAGIPARFCTGYNMSRLEGGQIYKNTNYAVLEADAHAFPELYIRGYGWVSFEPTITDGVVGGKKDRTATGMLTRAGMMILTGLLLSILFAMIYPWLSHKLFLIRSRKRQPNATVEAVIHRICKVYDIDSANTSREVGSIVRETTGSDLTYTTELFDRSVYGGETINASEKERALNEYTRAYEAFRESRKRRRITDR